jgi:hypothetical protein
VTDSESRDEAASERARELGDNHTHQHQHHGDARRAAGAGRGGGGGGGRVRGDARTRRVDEEGDDDLLPAFLPVLSLFSLARSALLRFASDFGGSRGGIRGVCRSWDAEFDFPGREF